MRKIFFLKYPHLSQAVRLWDHPNTTTAQWNGISRSKRWEKLSHGSPTTQDEEAERDEGPAARETLTHRQPTPSLEGFNAATGQSPVLSHPGCLSSLRAGITGQELPLSASIPQPRPQHFPFPPSPEQGPACPARPGPAQQGAGQPAEGVVPLSNGRRPRARDSVPPQPSPPGPSPEHMLRAPDLHGRRSLSSRPEGSRAAAIHAQRLLTAPRLPASEHEPGAELRGAGAGRAQPAHVSRDSVTASPFPARCPRHHRTRSRGGCGAAVVVPYVVR